MSTSEGASQPKRGSGRGTGRRGGAGPPRGNRGRGGSNRGQSSGKTPITDNQAGPKPQDAKSEVVAVTLPVPEPSEHGEEDVCWICAEPVKYYSVSECNHRTCHVCALRLRALYKRTDCTFCKEPQLSVIFTTSHDTLFSDYLPDSTPYKDSKLSILFETKEMMEETLILLRFNCPDPDCDYIGNGWGDLKLHIRASHGKLLCDLCLRSKKVFAHEHALYPPALLPLHLPSMHQRGKKDTPPEQIEGGIHPLCEFCRECFFSNDELYPHMRERHEECFICKRNEIQHQYFRDYESLEKHFGSAHYPCHNTECQARKFVVFNTHLDLQGHMVEEHGGDMTSRDRKIAQRVQAGFTFEDATRPSGRRPEQQSRPQPQQQQQQQQPAPGPSRPPANINARRAAFGGSLTTGDQNPNRNSPGGSRPASPPLGDRNIDPVVAERHAAFISRLENVAPNPVAAVPAVKAASRGYVSNESSAKDFILTIWNVLDRDLDNTASVVNIFVDLLEEEEKKQDLLASWKGFALEQRRQFPELVPTSVGSGYAGITSGHVLNAKKYVRTSHQPTNQIWDRVARAAGSSTPGPVPGTSSHSLRPGSSGSSRPTAFPPLSSTSSAVKSAGGPAPAPGFRQAARTTPWSASASGSRPATSTTSNKITVASVNVRQGPSKPPPPLSKSAFPELPSGGNSKARPVVRGNVSLKNILGSTGVPSVSAWAGDENGGSPTEEVQGEGTGADEGDASANGGGGGGGGKSKKKGKQKQTLFTLGSFPN
ncbi:hypothetical protein FA15DRAFT_670975 [Coprinopsis marcescibilis]|uniref:RING-type E3 ubiquitin transferase n=1 Tax=Coprinopsis marcescibilis TaxID=230819 RepID=A0A5C3KQZ8_COPMA|nr:hypothetical protein FA15DRAFT_670975 [Coprinopsis marcescibilis]